MILALMVSEARAASKDRKTAHLPLERGEISDLRAITPADNFDRTPIDDSQLPRRYRPEFSLLLAIKLNARVSLRRHEKQLLRYQSLEVNSNLIGRWSKTWVLEHKYP